MEQKRKRDDLIYSPDDIQLLKRARVDDTSIQGLSEMPAGDRDAYMTSLREWVRKDDAHKASEALRKAEREQDATRSTELETQRKEDGIEAGESEESVPPVFANYVVNTDTDTSTHPHTIVESAALSSVQALPINYVPMIGNARRHLSDAQFESVARAGECFQTILPNDTRKGFFIGDGTGVGKGRQAAAIIVDRIQRGRRRHVWMSAMATLHNDSKRDLVDIGCRAPVMVLHKMDYDEPILNDGILFVTYSTLIASNRLGDTRLRQIRDWLGADDFDGAIILDEAHRAKNYNSTRTADAIVRFQAEYKYACVVYMSATAGVSAHDLGYMSRLGMWGAGAPFPDFPTFVKTFDNVSRLELLCQDLKARGMMVARMLSFEGCGVEMRVCELTDADKDLYNAAAAWWSKLMQKTPRDVFSMHQVFFKQLLNSFKTLAALALIEDALARGECVVIGLQSTGESRAQDAAERGEEGLTSTPFEIARSLLDGLPDREAMLAELVALDLPPISLDIILHHFGTSAVAEMTGRRQRVAPVVRGDPCRTALRTSSDATTIEAVNMAEKTAFMSGQKKIAVLSDAASCGISLHADQRCINQAKRLHITIEMAWSAEKMLQQFGRTHRANQVVAPTYAMLVTDVAGERRFASAIADKIERLGAITRGDRRGGHGLAMDLIAHNLDTACGVQALTQLQLEAKRGVSPTDSITAKEVRGSFQRMQMDGGGKHTVNRFLNRLLCLDIATQNALFDAFHALLQKQVARAKISGDVDVGISVLAARRVKACTPTEILPATWVVPHWIKDGTSWSDVLSILESKEKAVLLQQKHSKRIMVAWNTNKPQSFRVLRPVTHIHDAPLFLHQGVIADRYSTVEATSDVRAIWRSQYSETRLGFLLCGALLPIWQRLEQVAHVHGYKSLPVKRIGARVGVLLTRAAITDLSRHINVTAPTSVPACDDNDSDDDDEDDELSFAIGSDAAGGSTTVAAAASNADDDDDDDYDELMALVGD